MFLHVSASPAGKVLRIWDIGGKCAQICGKMRGSVREIPMPRSIVAGHHDEVADWKACIAEISVFDRHEHFFGSFRKRVGLVP